MRKPLLVILLLFLSTFYSYSQDLVYTNNAFTGPEILPTTTNQTVYICIGSYANAYHSAPNCPAMGNCKAGIAYTDENTAAYTYGRKPCCHCWSNVKGNCIDDLVGAGRPRIKLFQRILVGRAGWSQSQTTSQRKR